MREFTSKLAVKTVAVLLCIACLVGGAAAWLVSGMYWDAIFYGDPGYAPAYTVALGNARSNLYNWLQYQEQINQTGALNYWDQEEYDRLTQALDLANTNFRFMVRHGETGELLYATAALPASGEETAPTMSPQEPAMLEEWRSTWSGEWYDKPTDTWRSVEYAIEYGVDPLIPVEDEISKAMTLPNIPGQGVIWLAAGLTLGALALTIFLCVCAGRKQGVAGVHRNWQDKIPLDLYALLSAGAIVGMGALCMVSLEEVVLYPESPYSSMVLALGGLGAVGVASLSLAALLTLVTRVKGRTFFTNTVIWKVLSWVGRGLGGWWMGTFAHWPITGRVIVLFLLYLILSALSVFTIIGFPIFQGLVLFYVCRWLGEWKSIRGGTQAIVGGDPGAAIDTAGMRPFPDLREHADQLNDLGGAINSAVEERMKSERMKAELITNVSHDLKTPLTSIINYVDLLKKEELQDEKAQEYIEVLDRKSQRLKKLTEDLVEASKASTGTLAVSRERLNLSQLIQQATGEYEEKLTQRGLSLVTDLPQGEVTVLADGRHLWRVLDNLLGNCAKYAMEGTRVYLTLAQWEGNAVLTVKNISAAPLNIPPDQLMERFVRGDESRTTEGSGLGLSIARSLTELQGGVFHLDIDGDLFKATVRLPEG